MPGPPAEIASSEATLQNSGLSLSLVPHLTASSLNAKCGPLVMQDTGRLFEERNEGLQDVASMISPSLYDTDAYSKIVYSQ